jgi:N-acetylglutamate synthase-like GNAT family acetyltransferase
MKTTSRAYPRTVSCAGSSIEIGLMTPVHAAELSTFVDSLPAHDLLFLRRDISHPKVIAAWMEALREGRVISLVAHRDRELVGCTAIVTQDLSWSRHVGELRVLVGIALRGTGLGRQLIQESFAQALDLGLEKLCVQMTVDQRAAIAVFEELGFRAEALLKNHVKDRAGQNHDLALLSHDVKAVQATMQAYGISDVFDSLQQGA